MHAMDSDLNLLKALDALLQTASVTRAAVAVGLSQPAMSHALARLREDLADPLLVRAGAGYGLTPRAEALRPRVQAALQGARGVFEKAEPQSPAQLKRTFTLGLADYTELVLLPALTAMLAKQAPGISLVCKSRLGSPAEVLERGEVDLWFGVDPPEATGLYAQKLVPDSFLCAVRKGHPVLARGGPTLKQFASMQHVQIAPGERPGGPLDDLLAARGLSRKVAVRLPHFLVAPLLVAKTDLVLTAPARVLRAFAGQARLHVFAPPLPIPPFTLHQVWHARHHADAAHKWFRERVREAMVNSDGFVLGPARRATSARQRGPSSHQGRTPSPS